MDCYRIIKKWRGLKIEVVTFYNPMYGSIQ